MGEREHAGMAGPAGTEASETSPGRVPVTAAAAMLELQRSVGNAAAVRLMRVPQGTDAPAAAPAAQTGADRFRERMRRLWGITDIRAATEADQIDDVARYGRGAARPEAIAGWQAWDPGPESPLYDDILDGFDAIATALGGIPPVSEIRFAWQAYENQGGVAVAAPHEGASYSSGHLRINRALETADWPLPDARSTAGVQAPLTTGGRAQSRRRIITHELCHGVYEQAGAQDRGVFTAWPAAAGWSGGQIIQNGVPLTRSNWNQDWPEQPVSAYSLNNPMEDFCESLTCYIERPGVLRARSPSRHAFIDGRAASWRSLLSPRLMSEPGDYNVPAADWRYA